MARVEGAWLLCHLHTTFPTALKENGPRLAKTSLNFCSSELCYQTNKPKKKSLVPTQIPVPTSPGWHSLLVTQHTSFLQDPLHPIHEQVAPPGFLALPTAISQHGGWREELRIWGIPALASTSSAPCDLEQDMSPSWASVSSLRNGHTT